MVALLQHLDAHDVARRHCSQGATLYIVCTNAHDPSHAWYSVRTNRQAPTDMWNYQEILHELKPTLLIEFGYPLHAPLEVNNIYSK